jgi:hypothetical protein
LKRLFSTTPEVRKETEANGGHRGDRTLNRTRSLFDRRRPVSVQRLRVFQFDDRTCSASGHCRPDASGRSGCLLDSNWTLALWRLVSSSARLVVVSLCALRLDQCVRSVTGPARPFHPSVSGYLDQHVRSVLHELAVGQPARPVSWTSASGERDFGCFSF